MWRIGSRCWLGCRPKRAPGARPPRSLSDGLFFVFPGAADFFGPVLVAVPIVEVVGDRRVATAGLVKISRSGAGFEHARVRTRSPAVHSAVSSLILQFAHRLCLFRW